MSLDPGAEHPHVQEGVCTCPTTFARLTYRDPLSSAEMPYYRPELTSFSRHCGLSSHRIAAAAAAELRRKD